MSSFTGRAGALSRSYNRKARREAAKARHGTAPHEHVFLQTNNSGEYRCECGEAAPDSFYHPEGKGKA